jgi:hypothetical protein
VKQISDYELHFKFELGNGEDYAVLRPSDHSKSEGIVIHPSEQHIATSKGYYSASTCCYKSITKVSSGADSIGYEVEVSCCGGSCYQCVDSIVGSTYCGYGGCSDLMPCVGSWPACA